MSKTTKTHAILAFLAETPDEMKTTREIAKATGIDAVRIPSFLEAAIRHGVVVRTAIPVAQRASPQGRMKYGIGKDVDIDRFGKSKYEHSGKYRGRKYHNERKPLPPATQPPETTVQQALPLETREHEVVSLSTPHFAAYATKRAVPQHNVAIGIAVKGVDQQLAVFQSKLAEICAVVNILTEAREKLAALEQETF